MHPRIAPSHLSQRRLIPVLPSQTPILDPGTAGIRGLTHTPQALVSDPSQLIVPADDRIGSRTAPVVALSADVDAELNLKLCALL